MTVKKNCLPKTLHEPDDAPELSAEFFKTADLYDGKQHKPRGRPKSAQVKEPIKLRLDPDVLAALRATGDGWQTRINGMLRAALKLSGRL